MKCVSERAKNLIETLSENRRHELLIKIRDIKSEMNQRGVLNSSMCVNEVCKACVVELNEFSDIILSELQRAHKSCNGQYSKSLSTELTQIFQSHFEQTKSQLASIQEQSVGNIARSMQNPNIIQFGWLENESQRILPKYRTEISMYVDNLHYSTGSTLVARINHAFSNRAWFAISAAVISVIIILGSFTDSLTKIATWLSSLGK